MNKFVLIEKPDNCAELVLGDVEFHRNLLWKGQKCLGGGFFKVKEDNRQIIMWGKSDDYGYPKFKGNQCYADWEILEINGIDAINHTDWSFYYLPDVSMPIDDLYKVNIVIK